MGPVSMMKLAPTPKDLLRWTPVGAPFVVEQHLIDIAAMALVAAWQQIVEMGFDVLVDEPNTTKVLHHMLGEVQANGGECSLFREYFETPDLEPQQIACKEGKQYRQFDLVLRPKNSPPGINPIYFGLFVECKLLIRGDKGLLQYAQNGIHRFVADGDYAHWMQQAFMLAYADATFSLDELVDYLETSTAADVPECKPQKHCLDSGGAGGNGVLMTEHPRVFIYPDGRGPGSIQLFHLWLHAA